VHFFDLIKQHRDNFVRITYIIIYFKIENLQRINDYDPNNKKSKKPEDVNV
jgi:hypothetical protein